MKTARHAKIIEIINKYNIETQEELADKLNEAGFQVTQATVSRDIRELKLMKISENGERQRYVVFQNKEGWKSEKYIRVLRDGFVSMVWPRTSSSSRPRPAWRWPWRWRWTSCIGTRSWAAWPG